ncbi:MAG: N-acyl homoserine lactonase family protein [Alphaproteobacteria bacterium]|nr:N-acyl homoserine lactonase family protein [Alphaproteobacteria bacterium]
MTTPDVYAVYAVRYAHSGERPPKHNFIFADAHDGPSAMDYFVWAAVGESRSFVIDMGFNRETAEKRGHDYLRCPAESLTHVDLDAASVEDVIITHMHWDHVGNFDKFPKARFHLQESEAQFVTGRYMSHKVMRGGFAVDDACEMVRQVYADRVEFHDGEAELASGFSVHHAGGHTMGHQFARVYTRRGWVVLASDAAHYYANMEQGNPFPAIYSVGENLASFRLARRLAESGRHVIPGHDPLVLQRYPPPSPELEGVVVRLDVDPKE